jgi:branched-chain amino acid transport system ATP-binding protein
MLEVDNVGKRFGKLAALNGVSISIPKGEIRGLIGPNGSGKTTMFNVISGFLQPTTGRIRFQGTDITGLRPHQIAKRGLVRTFQLTSIYRDMTVLENVLTGHHLQLGPRRLRRSDGANLPQADSAEESAAWILDFMGLSEMSDMPARLLPAGLQRVLSISTALGVRPSMLLLDEPLAGLNTTEKRRVSEKIAALRDRGITVLLVEHDVRSVLSICDRITVVNFGERIAEGTAEEITSNPEVVEAYLGSPTRYDA